MNDQNLIEWKSSGGVLFHEGKYLILNVVDHAEYVFPKGTIEPGETSRETCIREVKEETGYDVEITEFLLTQNYKFAEDGVMYDKYVDFYLVKLANNKPPKPSMQDGEKFKNLWLRYNRAREKLTHKDSKNVLDIAQKKLTATRK